MDVSEWVRSEASAGLLWAMRSPEVGPGLYGCADVGAGTTDSSFFRITDAWEGERWTKNRLVFYGARSGAPGMDALGALIAREYTKSLHEIRGQEEQLIRKGKLQNHLEVVAVCSKAFEVHRRAWADAYGKEKLQSRWMNHDLFILGGGSAVSPLCDHIGQRTWGHINPPTRRMAGCPPDIRWWSGKPYKGEATFLLVAYGLSYSGVDVPISDSPNEVPPLDLWQPRRPRGDVEELYPK